jgi:hypothetical protein
VPVTSLDVDWAEAAAGLRQRGWVRLPAALLGTERAELISAAPDTWSRQEDDVFGVKQGGMICGGVLHGAAPVVRHLATALTERLSHGAPELPPLPAFTDVSWTRDENGSLFITPHRDPPTAGGAIAVATLYGEGRFRVWDVEGRHEWDTQSGDIVLLRGKGWPADDAECPIHEAVSPVDGGRMVMTLRHNTGGPGADYFAALRSR